MPIGFAIAAVFFAAGLYKREWISFYGKNDQFLFALALPKGEEVARHIAARIPSSKESGLTSPELLGRYE
jgi:hypothetical protein